MLGASITHTYMYVLQSVSYVHQFEGLYPPIANNCTSDLGTTDYIRPILPGAVDPDCSYMYVEVVLHEETRNGPPSFTTKQGYTLSAQDLSPDRRNVILDRGKQL